MKISANELKTLVPRCGRYRQGRKSFGMIPLLQRPASVVVLSIGDVRVIPAGAFGGL